MLRDKSHGAFLQAANQFARLRIAVDSAIGGVRSIPGDTGDLQRPAVGPSGVSVG